MANGELTSTDDPLNRREEGLFFDIDRISGGGTAQAELLGIPSPTQLLEDFSGVTGARAAEQAALMQEQFAREGLAAQTEAQRRLEATLAPFVGFGRDIIPQLNQLFQPTVAGSVAASPTLQGFNEFNAQQLAANPFLAQLDPQGLQQSQLLSNVDLLSRERGDLLSAIGLGQASAAQQAAGDIQTGIGRTDLLSQIGNVQAAGGIGAANALGQGAGNIAGLGATLFGSRGRSQ